MEILNVITAAKIRYSETAFECRWIRQNKKATVCYEISTKAFNRIAVFQTEIA